MRRLLALCALSLLSVAALPLTPAAAATVTITISSTLNPRSVTIAPGTTITWRNADGERHRPRTQSGPEEFDVDLDPGESGSVTLSAAGTYRYADDRDEEDSAYWGTITVASGSSTGGTGTGGTGGTGGGTGGTGGTTTAPASASVSITDGAFTPRSVRIRTGGSVSWTNNDDREHTATGSGFDSGLLRSGGRYSRTFAAAGTYAYVCALHSDMTGTVAVVAPGAAAPPPGTARPAPRPPAPAPAGGSVAGGTSRPAVLGRPGSHTVAVLDFSYAPAALTARVGARISFVNRGQAPHTVTGSDLASGMLATGATWSTTARSVGTVSYVCDFHPQMRGRITVLAATAAVPTPPSSRPASPSPRASVSASSPASSADGGDDGAGPGAETAIDVVPAAGRSPLVVVGLSLGWLVVLFLGAVWWRTRDLPGSPSYVD